MTVTLPSTMVQPNSPHISNYTAAQAINPAQDFTLTWDAFAGADGADYVSLIVNKVFKTDGVGTSTSMVIPAGTMQASSNYVVNLGFYHAVWNTNGLKYSQAYRAIITPQFTLTTDLTNPSTPAPTLLSPTWGAHGFSFDIATSPGQAITVLYNTNLLSSAWQVLLSTNSPGDRIHITDPRSMIANPKFYWVRNGL